MFGTDYLAGSASSLKDCLELSLTFCSLEESIRMVSATPRNLLGLEPDSYTVFRYSQAEQKLFILASIIKNEVVYLGKL